MKRSVLWVVVLGILLLGLAAGPDLWAAPGQSLARQTVPTRTPTSSPTPSPTEPPPPPPTTSPMPTPTAVATSSALAGAVSAGGPSESLLPEAGARSVHLHLGMALMAVGLLVLAVVGRRV